MPRKPLIRSSIYPYHVYNRTLDKVFYERASLPEIWKYCEELLWQLSILHSVKIHAFVLMNNHFHLLVSTPEGNIDEFMRDFQSKLGKMILSRSNKQKFRFCGPYKWELIQDGAYYANAMKYVYQNPIRAGIVKSAEKYTFSTLSGKLGASPLKIPLHPSETFEYQIPECLEELSSWINTFLDEEKLSEMRTCWTKRKRVKVGRTRVKVKMT